MKKVNKLIEYFAEVNTTFAEVNTTFAEVKTTVNPASNTAISIKMLSGLFLSTTTLFPSD